VPRQAPVTVRAPVVPARRGDVDDALRTESEAGAPDRSASAGLGLAGRPDVHFARLFVLEATRLSTGEHVPATLVYMADVDGTVADHLRDLATTATDVVDTLFGACEGYPADPSHGTRMAWLLAHTLTPAARYVHHAGRTVSQVRDETRLRTSLRWMLDRGEVAVTGPAVGLRDRLRAAFLSRADSDWAAKAPATRSLAEEVEDSLHLYAGLAAAALLSPVVVPAAVVWLLLVRRLELADTQEDGVPDQAHVDEVRRYEDVGAQNPFTAVGEVKPGLVRHVTMRVALAGLDFANRHAFARDDLAGVDSIHFARWVLLDGDRRLVFASSYDGSLESYMDDFISRLSWGINLVFSNGVGFPRARWLVLGGSRDEIRYKHYLRRHQVATPVFYSAYPRLTARNLDDSSHVRAGLASRSTHEEGAARWLSLL
jgi:hypothetical protein